MVEENQTAKVLLGKMPSAQASHLQSLLEKQGIHIAAVHNRQTCQSGCSTEIEIWAHPDDREQIAEAIESNWARTLNEHGYDPALSETIFDPSCELAICPACAHQFATSLGECPDCGLQFTVTAEGGKSCKTGNCK